MGHRNLKKRMEGSDYEDKCSQQANDVERMSNREKRKDKSKKRIGANHNISPPSYVCQPEILQQKGISLAKWTFCM